MLSLTHALFAAVAVRRGDGEKCLGTVPQEVFSESHLKDGCGYGC